eukprot:gene15447-54017_t
MGERRRDPTNPPSNPQRYTEQQFVEFYGPGRGAQLWSVAGRQDGSERRPDPTNPPGSKQTFSRPQFIEFYGPYNGPQ